MNTCLVKIENLSLTYYSRESAHKALTNVSLELYRGETIGLVGESGSGKSTIAHALLGLLPKQAKIESGNIHAFDRDFLDSKLNAQKKLRGRDISMIFQDPMSSLTPHLSIGKQMIEPLIQIKKLTHEQACQKSIDLLRDVDIPDPENVYHKYPHECSGGMCQRVMIAIALSSEPQLLVADEPTTALDVTTQATILKILKQLQKKHQMTLLFVSHDLGVIHQVCDKISVMHNGKIVEQGNKDLILSSPRQDYTKNLIASIPRLEGEQLDYLPKSDISFQLAEKPNLTETTTPLLKVDGLSIEYSSNGLFSRSKTFKAVKNVNFELQAGKILGIVGESGSGKSTTAKAIAGLLKYQSGQIVYKEQLIKNIQPDIQMIFQDPAASLNPRMTVGRNISEALIHKNISSHEIQIKVLELLEQVHLAEHYSNRYPHELSGGQQQRIGIARALAANPKLLICDEPVSALDVSVQAQVLNLLKHLQRNLSLSMLFITHDISVIRFIADKLIVMKSGEVVEAGNTETILKHPQQSYTKNLLASVPKINF